MSNKFKQTKKQPSINNLIIFKHLPGIVENIMTNMITLIRSDTGSGKTIGVPNYLSREMDIQRIFCSVPTIAATLSASLFQTELCHHISYESRYVGYSYQGEIHYDHTSKIVYCTTGHLLNKMIRVISNIFNGKTRTNKFNPWFCSVLILDEFHIRTKETDLCLCLWITMYNKWVVDPINFPLPPRLVIMSATLDDDVIKLLPIKPTISSFAIEPHPVSICFDDKSATFPIQDTKRYVRAARIARDYHIANYDGTYLIFVPGKAEIDIVISELETLFRNEGQLIQAHGDLVAEELIRIHEQPELNKRKIVVATNIAECSITIEDVSLVIDSLTQRIASSDLDDNLKLDLAWISKMNSKQRKGRTGRTCAGVYIALTSENNYDKFVEGITPEIERISINYDILKLMKHKIDPVLILDIVIDRKKIISHIQLLKDSGFVTGCYTDSNENLNEKLHLNPEEWVTDMGDFCSEFPIGIRKSAMLYYLHQENNPDLFLYLSVICTLNCYGSGIVHLPLRKKGEDYLSYKDRVNDIIEEIRIKFAGYSTVDTIFNIWIEICYMINPFHVPSLQKFCSIHKFNFKRFREITNILKQCIIIGTNMNLNITYDHRSFIAPDSTSISKTFQHLLDLTHPDCKMLTMRHEFICDGKLYNVDEKSVHTHSLYDSIKFSKTGQLIQLKNLPTCYAVVRSTSGKKNFINVFHTIEHDDTTITNGDNDDNTDSWSCTSPDNGNDNSLYVLKDKEPLFFADMFDKSDDTLSTRSSAESSDDDS